MQTYIITQLYYDVLSMYLHICIIFLTNISKADSSVKVDEPENRHGLAPFEIVIDISSFFGIPRSLLRAIKFRNNGISSIQSAACSLETCIVKFVHFIDNLDF